MEAKASVTDVHTTPKKLRILLDDVKKMKPVKAMEHLMYSPKKSAEILYKVIKSAVDNAKATLQIDANLLEFKLLKVDQGHSLRRFNPGGRGTAKPYRKQFAHISVVVGVSKGKETKQAVKKEEKKTESTEVANTDAKKTLKVAKKPSLKKKTAAQVK